MTRRAYSKAEVAEMVGVSASTVKRAIRAGELHAKYVRRQVRISADEVERWWAGLKDSTGVDRSSATRTRARLTTPPPPPRGRVERLIDLSLFITDREQRA